MMTLLTRSGALAPYMQATSFTVAGPLKALVPGVPVKSERVLLNPKKLFLCRESLNGQSPTTGPAITVSLNACSAVRLAHTDVRVPDFSGYRQPEVLDPHKSSQDTSESRRVFSYLVTGATAVTGVYAAKTVVTQFVSIGDYGGYYCPCHGSHYDASGRIRRGPAPLNLEVPYYEFADEDTVVVG